MPRLKCVAKFYGPGGREWKIYHGRKTDHLNQFTDPVTEEVSYAITWFAGRYAGKIFVDTTHPKKIFELTHHELMHVALRDMGLHPIIEEAFVDETSARMAVMLEQLGVLA